MQSKRSKGITRNKTELLFLCKQAKRKKSSRFAKENLLGLELDDNMKSSGLKNQLIELERMPTMSSLPPEWYQKYEECLANIRGLSELKKKIMAEQSRRLTTVKVNEQKQAEHRIYELTTEATIKIKKCERLIEEIKKIGSKESQTDRKTCTNICMGLAMTVQEKTKELRGQQRAFIEQRQQIQSSTKVSFLELAAEKAYDDDFLEDEMEQNEGEFEMELKMNEERNSQILKIVESIHELNDLYKELNNLVIMQGSLLDRIDFNIEDSAIQVKKANETLGKVEEKQKKSKCACWVMALMILAVIILGIVLIVRWSH